MNKTSERAKKGQTGSPIHYHQGSQEGLFFFFFFFRGGVVSTLNSIFVAILFLVYSIFSRYILSNKMYTTIQKYLNYYFYQQGHIKLVKRWQKKTLIMLHNITTSNKCCSFKTYFCVYKDECVTKLCREKKKNIYIRAVKRLKYLIVINRMIVMS